MRNIFLILLIVVGMITTLTGCTSSVERESKKAIRAKLVDPNSAIFTNFIGPQTIPQWEFSYRGGKLIRVNVNAKNRMGGYVGTAEWVVIFDHDGKITDVGPGDEITERLTRDFQRSSNNAKARMTKEKRQPEWGDLIVIRKLASILAVLSPHTGERYLKEAREIMEQARRFN